MPQSDLPNIDFLTGKFGYRHRHAHRGNELLAKVVGIKGHYKPLVIDATAGLGRDGFLLACLGCQVTMLERSPQIAALLKDALHRVQTAPDFADDLKITLINVDAINYLQKLTAAEYPDVIYLDPMHPPRSKSALVKKEMRILREVVGDDNDATTLLQTALTRAKKRVVVKRPRLSPPLGDIKPSFIISGKQQRFDIYQTSFS